MEPEPKPDTPIVANVRKKGRPRLLTDAQFGMALEQFGPFTDYRTAVRNARCGTAIHILGNDERRFPWLLGHPLQVTVLSEMCGVPPDCILAIADKIEELHSQEPFNAKHGRRLVRQMKSMFRPKAIPLPHGSPTPSTDCLPREPKLLECDGVALLARDGAIPLSAARRIRTPNGE